MQFLTHNKNQILALSLLLLCPIVSHGMELISFTIYNQKGGDELANFFSSWLRSTREQSESGQLITDIKIAPPQKRFESENIKELKRKREELKKYLDMAQKIPGYEKLNDHEKNSFPDEYTAITFKRYEKGPMKGLFFCTHSFEKNIASNNGEHRIDTLVRSPRAFLNEQIKTLFCGKYSAIGSSIVADITTEDKIYIIQQLLTCGFKPTNEDKELAALELWEGSSDIIKAILAEQWFKNEERFCLLKLINKNAEPPLPSEIIELITLMIIAKEFLL